MDVYLPLLFLANRKYVTLTQEVLFEDIFIRRGERLDEKNLIEAALFAAGGPSPTPS